MIFADQLFGLCRKRRRIRFAVFDHGLDAYRQLTHVSSGFLEPPIRAVWTSLRYASIATVIALLVGGAAAVRTS